MKKTTILWSAVLAYAAVVNSAKAQSYESLKAQSGIRFGEGGSATAAVQPVSNSPLALLTSGQAKPPEASARPAAAKASGEPPSPVSANASGSAHAETMEEKEIRIFHQNTKARSAMVRFSKFLDKADAKIAIAGHLTGLRFLAAHHPLFLGAVLIGASVVTGGLFGGGLGIAVGVSSALAYASGVFQGGQKPKWIDSSSPAGGVHGLSAH